MKFKQTGFQGLILIYQKLNFDNRGSFKETFRKDKLEELVNYKIDFCQENSVNSKNNVLRGLHFQLEPFSQSKLITVSKGKIFDVAVDIRKDSATYGKYFSYILSASNQESLFIPKGFAHGYFSLSDDVSISYLVDNYYNPKMESGISYRDDFLNIEWPFDDDDIIISEKDKKLNSFKW